MLKDGRYPADIQIKVLEEDANTKYLVIPRLPDHVDGSTAEGGSLTRLAVAQTCIDLTYTDVGCVGTEDLCTLICETVLTCPEVCDL